MKSTLQSLVDDLEIAIKREEVYWSFGPGAHRKIVLSLIWNAHKELSAFTQSNALFVLHSGAPPSCA